MSISRRDFLRGTAMGASALAAGGSALSVAAADRFKNYREMLLVDALSGFYPSTAGFKALEKSGITVVSQTQGARGKPTFSYEAAVRDLVGLRGLIDNNERLILVNTTADILEAKRTGKLAWMANFQNGTHLQRNLDNVKFFYDLGIRQIQLTYNTTNALAAGCVARHDHGLTHFGVEVVKKMNELGIIIDVSHTGKRSTMEAIEVSEQPVLFTHSNCEALSNNPRCKDDEEIKAMAARGGVMGITTVNFFVSQKEKSTFEDFMAHIYHVVDLVGIDYVGIGSDSGIAGWRAGMPDEKAFWDAHKDFKGVDFRPEVDVRWPPFIEELDVPEKMLLIAEALDKQGYKGKDIAKVMGLNFMRAYAEIIG